MPNAGKYCDIRIPAPLTPDSIPRIRGHRCVLGSIHAVILANLLPPGFVGTPDSTDWLALLEKRYTSHYTIGRVGILYESLYDY